ncbi:MAG: fumarylacetoacetate hydrolase family protein [Thermoleophilia bacterium]|nr:fumarylacetoacetate hydrolase family protein [Thermoleophilia bacterium]
MDGLRRVSFRGQAQLVAARDGALHPLEETLGELLAGGLGALHEAVDRALAAPPLAGVPEAVLAPIDAQEVWASGVTYERSRQARVEEAVVKSVYDLVFEAERPELFLKAAPGRVPPPGAPLRIRADSTWDVPEPELALVLTAAGEIAGYLVADDVSSRSIEGQNPLYLAQAKIYDDSLGLSGTIVLARELGERARSARISLAIERDGRAVFSGETSTAQMRRPFETLAGYLYRELSHPEGAVLLTGTGLVPPDDFTLEDGDVVEIEIEGVDVLRHPVYRAPGVAP